MIFCAENSCGSFAAQMRCSKCKHTYYWQVLNAQCQKKDWKNHKKGCAIQCLLNEYVETAEAEAAKQPVKKPRRTHCTGCNARFDPEDVYVDRECPDCGYMTCESCSCHNSKGQPLESSNFGHLYCESDPRPYHLSSRTGRSYKGDYHPEGGEMKREGMPELYEDKERECNNCGKVKFCLRSAGRRAGLAAYGY
ncbi:hypothetical protein C8J56DRAFT_793816 [Mycena floridula]|nr:hypothetical protein C8J56DRAFT_793816 [Mycena floridula]